jgi:hypothetical protein
MIHHPYIHEAIARDRRATMLAKADAARLVRNARSHRQRAKPPIRRSPFRWIPDWLRSARSRVLAWQLGSRSERTSTAVALHDSRRKTN